MPSVKLTICLVTRSSSAISSRSSRIMACPSGCSRAAGPSSSTPCRWATATAAPVDAGWCRPNAARFGRMVANPTVKQRRLARKLKEARLAAGMTHDQAAEALDCKQPKISKIENAQVSVNSDDVRTLAETYGLSVDRVE